MLHHREERIRRVYEALQRFSTVQFFRQEKKIKRRAKKIVVGDSQIGKRNFQRNIIHIYDDVVFCNRTTNLYNEAIAANPQF